MRGRVAFVAVAVAVVASACDGPRGPEARGVTASPQAPGRDDRERRDQAAALMLRFAERTGLTSARAERRYLWTDAFAVCNFLGLARATGEARYTELALRLIDRVHHTLGKHRADDARTGWLSGLSAQDGEAHPTRGGLRIGKELPERRPDQPFDERLEWERDGQYFHYLTQWMHALDRAARATATPRFNRWGRELAETARAAFAHGARGTSLRRMYWKMSIDLGRPLVPSMGQHDALDGYVACAELRATAAASGEPAAGPTPPTLEDEARDFARMIDVDNLATADPLGIGGLLVDAHRLDRLVRRGAGADGGLRDRLLGAAIAGLEQYARAGDLGRPAERRLAFRELGLAIGLHAVAAMRRGATDEPERRLLEALRPYDRLADDVIAFWLEPEHQRSSTFVEHEDINEVMLATALAPEGFLGEL
ncbi:MAG TPA: hypothetical protein VKE22_05215 [Haliangiales bacterium]|nr:hypothetical protein [Haliangiales bacterium]